MDYSITIQDIAKKTLKPIQNIAINGFKRIAVFDIDCSELKDYNFVDIRKAPEYKKLFQDLAELKGPVLYIFKNVSDCKPKDIVDNIKLYSTRHDKKAVPAIKTNYFHSNILYVGKVEKNFWGRVIQHLGFYKVKGTQGLQLFYWAKSINLKLELIAMEFENEACDLMPLFEMNLADKLKPILGKHS